jgi:hypothetical protein
LLAVDIFRYSKIGRKRDSLKGLKKRKKGVRD